MRVRIVRAPVQREVDGVPLESLARGTVRDVSPIIGAWLIAEGYAEPEMRAPRPERMYSSFDAPRSSADSSGPRRRRDD